MNNRALALDALRGYAIITMVLSATIVTHVLPGWMSHAQTPPDHVFNPLLPGITWVDLVFPFFLFAMGAAFPFSIKKRAEKGDSKLKLVYYSIPNGLFFGDFYISLVQEQGQLCHQFRIDGDGVMQFNQALFLRCIYLHTYCTRETPQHGQ